MFRCQQIFIIILGLLLLACYPMFHQSRGTALTVRPTDALLGPDWSQKLVTTLKPNTKLNLIRMERDWYEVQLPDGSFAWVHRRNVTIIPYGDLIITDTARIRDAPGLQFGVITTLPAGTKVTKLEVRGDWVHIALPNGRDGWVHTSLVAGL